MFERMWICFLSISSHINIVRTFLLWYNSCSSMSLHREYTFLTLLLECKYSRTKVGLSSLAYNLAQSVQVQKWNLNFHNLITYRKKGVPLSGVPACAENRVDYLMILDLYEQSFGFSCYKTKNIEITKIPMNINM